MRPHELVLRTSSKDVFDFLTKKLGLPYRCGKGKKVTIPQIILSSDWKLRRCVRCIMDTDGSIFFAKKKGYRDDYPSIEISTASIGLAENINKILKSKDFRIGFIKQVPTNPNWNVRYIISIYGEKMIEKWVKEIGFSNPKYIGRYCAWKKPK